MGLTRHILTLAGVVAAAVVICGIARADDKPKDEKKKADLPLVQLAKPLGLAAGSTQKITLRGEHLDDVTEIKFDNGSVTAKVLSKGAAPAQDQNAPKKLGPTQVEIELKAADDLPAKELSGVVVTPAGQSAFTILVAAKVSLVAAQPFSSGGFRGATPLKIGQCIDATIDHPKAVHTFEVTANAGEKFEAEVFAARRGSTLDSLLTAYDAKAHQIAVSDDIAGSTDSKLSLTMPGDGVLYLSVMDAQDRGSAEHVYRLVLRPVK